MKFSKEIIEKLAYHLEKGSTITDACVAAGISRETLYDWMNKKPDVSDTIKKAKAIPDRKVVKSLYLKAKGTTHTERHFTVSSNGKKSLIKEIRKKIYPDTTAIIFWLKNRMSEEFKDKQEYEHSGTVTFEVSDKFLPKESK